ncbi:uncharacterized protein [Leptinotarsa decemlineata]|uniref:uncharacterized protein n=1 Tax=Leptinotarsa decemlineata TaxID=7539 RepID=UPI003D308641
MESFPTPYPTNIKSAPPWFIQTPIINTLLSQFPKHDTNKHIIKQNFRQILDQFDHPEGIYSDSSKTHLGVGAAVVTDYVALTFKLPETATILTVKLFAILQALQYAKSSASDTVSIISDSLSVLQLLQRIYIKHPIGILIKQQFFELQSLKKKIILLWVPSHVGIVENESADFHAREAIDNPNQGITMCSPHTDLKIYFKSILLRKWNIEWQSTPFKLREWKPKVGPWNYGTLKRREQVIITRLRLGHNKVIHEYLISLADQPQCYICEVALTIHHIIVQCPVFQLEREMCKISTESQETLSYFSASKILNYLSALNLSNKI